MGVYGTDSLLEPASSGQSMNYSFGHRVGFPRESGRLPLGQNAARGIYMNVSLKETDCLQKGFDLILSGKVAFMSAGSAALFTAVTGETSVSAAPKAPPAGRE